MPAQDIATGHYLQPAVMTAPGDYAPLLADLPRGIAGLAEVAHGLPRRAGSWPTRRSTTSSSSCSTSTST
jgi:hypothetical protein